ncbi:MAG: heme ABC transporter permease, partial [Proteobacteria bacterium]|nr:heme ABC transporter permease [Pseudomonadota bacterium]
ILATKSSFKNKEQGDKLIAILALVGLVDLPIIHYSVYWWNSLHQGSTLTVFAKPKIALTMLYPLLLSLLGFAFYSAWVLIKNARLEVLQRDYRQNWVKKMIGENA